MEVEPTSTVGTDPTSSTPTIVVKLALGDFRRWLKETPPHLVYQQKRDFLYSNAPQELGEERNAWFELSQKWDAWHDEQIKQRQAAAAREYRLAAFKKEIGPRFALCSLDNFTIDPDPKHAARQNEVVEKLRGYVEKLDDNLRGYVGIWAYGAAGAGKDHLVNAVAMTAIERGQTIAYATATGLAMRVRATMRNNASETEEDIVEELSDADILFVSDLCPLSGALTDFQLGILCEIVDIRYKQLRPIWATVNVVDRNEANERLGAPLVSRLAEGAVVCHCDWPDYRKSGRPCPTAPKPMPTGEVNVDFVHGKTSRVYKVPEDRA
jgi:DNA replication protein DnaC